MIRPEPDWKGAARGNVQQLEQALLHLRNRIRDLEAAMGGAAIDLKKRTRVSARPPYAGFAVSKVQGRTVIRITNPQDRTAGANPHRAPVYHHLELATDQQFSQNLVALPVTTQTYIETSYSQPYVRLRSSFDGRTTNRPQFASAGK